MKSYFAINHNPDAKDLKQLSQKTGLPKRVLQVSFVILPFTLPRRPLQSIERLALSSTVLSSVTFEQSLSA